MSAANVNYREGSRSEYLAWFALSTVGFTVQVPRQEDYFLTDFLVHLFDERGLGSNRQAHPTGESLAMQVKSNTDELTLGQRDARLLRSMQIPWFLAVCDRHKQRLAVYSTNDRHLLPMTPKQLKITFERRLKTVDDTWPIDLLRLGQPIIRVNLDDLESDSVDLRRQSRTRFRKVLGAYAWVDMLNIATRRKGLPVVARVRPAAPGQYDLRNLLEPVLPLADVNVNAIAGGLGEAVISLRHALYSGLHLSKNMATPLSKLLADLQSRL